MTPPESTKKSYYIKRIVGLPGEVIKFDEGKVFIKKSNEADFQELQEQYLSDSNKNKTYLPQDMEEAEFIIPD